MRLPLLVLMAVVLPGCTDPYAGEPDQVSEHEWTLEPGSFYQPTFETEGPVHVRAHVRVVNGSAVDVFLATGATCADYPTGAFAPAARLLSSTNGSLEADLPAGRHCLVLDNHDAPAGTSPGAEPVTVFYRIETWERRG